MPTADESVQLVQVRSCTPMSALTHPIMIDVGSLLRGFVQLAMTPGRLAPELAGEVVAPAATAEAVTVADAAELPWFPWHPATARPSVAQRARLLNVCFMPLKTKFAPGGCIEVRRSRPVSLPIAPARRADDGHEDHDPLLY